MDEIFLPIVRPPSLKANQFPIWHPKNYTFIFLNVTFVLVKGRQWAGSGRPNPFLLGPWAQWAGHNGLLTN